MYRRRCRKCCMQKNYNYNNVIESINASDVDNDYSRCDCGYDKPESIFPDNPVLGQSYVPIQKMDKTFIPSVGLKKGTIFPELVMPYYPCQSMEEIAFIKAMNTVKEGCNKC